MTEGRRLQQIGRTAKDPVKLRRGLDGPEFGDGLAGKVAELFVGQAPVGGADDLVSVGLFMRARRRGCGLSPGRSPGNWAPNLSAST
jgi:hypothetical protein